MMYKIRWRIQLWLESVFRKYYPGGFNRIIKREAFLKHLNKKPWVRIETIADEDWQLMWDYECFEEEMPKHSWFKDLEHYKAVKSEALLGMHYGDCISVANACLRCQAETMYLEMLDWKDSYKGFQEFLDV